MQNKDIADLSKSRANDIPFSKAFFNVNVLEKVFKDRGYLTRKSMIRCLSKELNSKSPHKIENKLTDGKLTYSDILMIAIVLEMTPKEFCDCFLSGLFQEDEVGRFKACKSTLP